MKQLTLFCFVGLFATTVHSGSRGDNLVIISPIATIASTPEKFQSKLAVIPGVRSCGGPAQVINWRFESCTDDKSGICQIPADGKNKKSEFSFVPSEYISNGIEVRFNITADNVPSRFYEVSVPDSAVRGGRVYTLKHSGTPTKEFQGKLIKVQYVVVRQEDNSVEACAEADFQVV